MSPANFMNLCRLCLVKDKVSIPIFEGEGEVRKIFMKIVTCLPVKVERQDQLPKKICDVCLYNVENVFKFWHTTANSEKKLLQWLEESGKVDNLPMPNSSSIETEQVMLKEETIEQEHVSEHIKSQDNEGSQDDMEQSDLEDTFSDEDGFNSEEDPVNDNIGDKKDSEKEEGESEEEDGETELEPTTFVNVAMACEEPGPSGLQSGQTLEQDVESVEPKITPMVLQPIEEKAAESVKADPDVVPSTSKTVPASSGSREEIEKWMIENAPDGRAWNVFYSLEGEDCDENQKYHTVETCNVCEESFNFNEMQVHKKIHTGHKPYICIQCNTECETKLNLRTHMKSHSGDQVHYCYVCGEKCIGRNLLHEHMTTHNEIRLFRCEICNKRFNRLSNLSTHKNIHKGKKKYSCDICDYASIRKDNLDNHRKRHTKEYSHRCEVCNKGFHRKCELLVHQKKHHGNNNYVFNVWNIIYP